LCQIKSINDDMTSNRSIRFFVIVYINALRERYLQEKNFKNSAIE